MEQLHQKLTDERNIPPRPKFRTGLGTRPVVSNVPEKKTDLVSGKYEVSAPIEDRPVAVKIIDMLGEEVLFIGQP